MNSNLEIWWNVPEGCTFNLSVSPDGNYAANARVTSTIMDEIQWNTSQLLTGASKTMSAGESSCVRVSVTFQGDQTETATIHAQVKDPAGQVIQDGSGNSEYRYVVQGKAGDPTIRASLNVVAS